ncbi:hypothetical protein B0H13DRAFT_1871215 [Mycena leptocephala]|nr:hypothetical protein B0H13DRAFT_1871215 [Mycena leptocephala]
MPWGWAKPLGLSDSKLLHHLWRFVGPHWLAGSQRNDMLKLLHKVNNDSALAWRIRIQGIALTPKIIDTHKAGTETYQNSQSFGWLRDVGNDLVRNQAALIATAHLGNIINEPYWIGLVLDLSRPAGEILYGDSFDKPIPASLLAALRWWISQHTGAHLGLGKLTIGVQEDGFSCAMLVDNAQQHFVDPEIPLTEREIKYVNARLRAFNQIGKWSLKRLEIARALAIKEDEDSDDYSDPCTATGQNDSDHDSNAPTLIRQHTLRHTARGAKFTFTCSPSPPDAPTTAGVKRAKGHPDAPSPNPSPEERRIYKRGADDAIRPPPPFIFELVVPSSRRRRSVDVFGPVDGYGTDSESDSDREPGRGDDGDEYAWGPEDDAPHRRMDFPERLFRALTLSGASTDICPHLISIHFDLAGALLRDYESLCDTIESRWHVLGMRSNNFCSIALEERHYVVGGWEGYWELGRGMHMESNPACAHEAGEPVGSASHVIYS